MNKAWIAVVTVCGTIIALTSPDDLLTALLLGAESAVSLSVRLLPAYVVWSGILALIEKSGLGNKIAKFMSPIITRLFRGESEATRGHITMNFTANLLGMGGAATPLGIKAISAMDDGSGRATKNQVLFTVMNATSLSLIPTTLISLRLSYGSASPSDIILPSVIVSAVSTLISTLAVSVFSK